MAGASLLVYFTHNKGIGDDGKTILPGALR